MNLAMISLGQTSTLDRQITELSEILAPSASDAVAYALKAMGEAGMSVPTSIKPDESVAVYRFAMQGLPAIALRAATEKLIRGEYDRPCLGIIPTPPELAALVRIEAASYRGDMVRLRSAKDSVDDAERLRQPRDEGAKRRVREIRERFRRGDMREGGR